MEGLVAIGGDQGRGDRLTSEDHNRIELNRGTGMSMAGVRAAFWANPAACAVSAAIQEADQSDLDS